MHFIHYNPRKPWEVMHVSRIILCINAYFLSLCCSKWVGTLTCSRRTQELAISEVQQLYDINLLILYNKQHTMSYKSMKLSAARAIVAHCQLPVYAPCSRQVGQM